MTEAVNWRVTMAIAERGDAVRLAEAWCEAVRAEWSEDTQRLFAVMSARHARLALRLLLEAYGGERW